MDVDRKNAAVAVALLRNGRAAEAEAEANRLLAIDPQLGAAWACLGFARQQQGKDPLPALEAAARHLPQDGAVHHALGQLLEERGLPAQAAKSFEHAVQLRPDIADLHNDLGRTRLAAGDVNGAIASCRRALELRPGFAAAHGNLANAEHARGNLTAAIDEYRHVVALEPDHPIALRALGRTLVAAGRPDEALPYVARLAELRPDALTLADFGVLLTSLGRYGDAAKQYRAALALRPDEARLHSNLAHALQCAGDLRGAIAAGRSALALDARLPEAYLHLGNALLALMEVPQAEACYRDGLAVAPDHRALLTAHAMVLRAMGRLNESEASARRALALRRAPDLLALLGNLALDRGRFDEAADCYREALALDPLSPEALVGVARTRRMSAADREWRDAAERALARGLPVAHAANLRHALGKYHEDIDESEAAFAAHAAANALSRKGARVYDQAATHSRVDAIIAAYDRETIEALHAAGSAVDSDRPVFIVGMPRSGTTLTEQILASHPDVYGADELPFWNLAAERVRTSAPVQRAATIAAFAREYLALLAKRSATSARVIDKLPGNFENLGLIHAALPGARIIHVERDPRDTCLSIFFQGFTSAHAYATDLEDLAHYYREYQRLMRHWHTVLPVGALLEMPYEALVADAETWIRRLLAHVGLPWDARCLDFHRTERAVLTASAWQVRQPLSPASIGRWRRYEAMLGPLLRGLDAQA
jgi:tetratricopeptide (TPR) repeat protein